MEVNELKEKIEEMLKEAMESAKQPYLNDLTYSFCDGKVYALEKVLELFGRVYGRR